MQGNIACLRFLNEFPCNQDNLMSQAGQHINQFLKIQSNIWYQFVFQFITMNLTVWLMMLHEYNFHLYDDIEDCFWILRKKSLSAWKLVNNKMLEVIMT